MKSGNVEMEWSEWYDDTGFTKWGVLAMQQRRNASLKWNRDLMTTIQESVGVMSRNDPPRLKPIVILRSRYWNEMGRMNKFFNLYAWSYRMSVVCVRAIHVSEFCGCMHRTEQ